MNHKFFIAVCFLYTGFFVKAFAQQKNNDFFVSKVQNSVNNKINAELIRHDISKIKCGGNCLFARFSADENGNIFNLLFNKGADSTMQFLIKQALLPLQTKKNSIVSEKIFLQTVIYDFASCTEYQATGSEKVKEIMTDLPDMDINTGLQKNDENRKQARSRLYRNEHYNLLNMLYFTDSATGKELFMAPLECIVLPPIHLVTKK